VELALVKLPPFEYACPATLAEAVSLLASRGGDAKVLAGGQSLVPMMAFRLVSPSLLVDLRKLGLNEIVVDDHGVRLGARVRWRDILDDRQLRVAHPLLVAAITHVAHYQIRNRGTVGGSLAHADPAAEMPGIAVACDAWISVMGSGGARVIHVRDFFKGPLTTALAPDEIITEIGLPSWPAGRRWGFQEFARRRGDFAMAAAAVHYDENTDRKACNAHIAVFGVGDRPRRLSEAEAILNGVAVTQGNIAKAAELAAASIDPPDDIHAKAPYRRALAGTMVERALFAASS
jgi:aerobic carbon-monoxide dehydrogenase medium subunit